MASARSFWHVSSVRTGFPKEPPAAGIGGFMSDMLGMAPPTFSGPYKRLPQICPATKTTRHRTHALELCAACALGCS
jgi:hypothetical protein